MKIGFRPFMGASFRAVTSSRVCPQYRDCKHDDQIGKCEQEQDVECPMLSTQFPIVEEQLEHQTATPEDGQKAAHTSSQQRSSRQFFRKREAHPGCSDHSENDKDVLNDEHFCHMSR